MSKQNRDSPATPTPEYTFYNGVEAIGCQHFGLTKRETIAMHVMASMMGSFDSEGNWMSSGCEKEAAEHAVKAADAILEALG